MQLIDILAIGPDDNIDHLNSGAYPDARYIGVISAGGDGGAASDGTPGEEGQIVAKEFELPGTWQFIVTNPKRGRRSTIKGAGDGKDGTLIVAFYA